MPENKYASRKFILALLVILFGVALTIWGKMTSEHLVDLMKWISGMYFGLNVTEKATSLLTPKGSQ